MRIISGEFGGRTVRSVSGPGDHARGFRPATSKVRQAVFSMLEARGASWSGMRVADLFAGTGSLGLEAMSRGADFALFVEKDRRAVGCIKGTLADFGLGRDRFEVQARDLFSVLKASPRRPFDLVFIDPPYGRDLLAPALQAAIKGDWLAPGALVLAEVEAALDAKAALDKAPAAAKALNLETDRLYGQTRILLWTLTSR